jgi:uncharacterized membrane protein
MDFLPAALTRHLRFYIALLLGIAAFFAARPFGADLAPLAAGNVFYLVFLILSGFLIAGQTPADIKRRAKREDEGIVIVLLIVLATMGFFCVAVFVALREGFARPLPLALAALGAPLGWLTLHTLMAFHYADIHYFDDPDTPGRGNDLEFPGKGDAGLWDFLYFSFVIGMTAQVSDVQVKTSAMRRAVLYHGVISFFFNTVFIAMAVNAGVALAGGSSS